MDNFTIEKASISDHSKLTAITLEGKAYWGYSAEQLSVWTNELTITPKYINENEIYKLILDSKIIGYYSYLEINKSEIKLDNLFLSSIYIGKGFGKILMVDFLKRMKKSKIENIFLEADPNAENFYKKFGFVTFDHKQSSIKGRFIPLMKLHLYQTSIIFNCNENRNIQPIHSKLQKSERNFPWHFENERNFFPEDFRRRKKRNWRVRTFSRFEF